MTTRSFPAVGADGFTEAQWALMYGATDGLIADQAGDACAITLINSTDTVRIAAGRLRVDGYVLEIGLEDGSPGYEELSCPAVQSGTVTYYIGGLYDPALNVKGSDGYRSLQGPCRLGIWTTLDRTGGKSYAPLYTITRSASQLLTAAKLTDYRRWSGGTVSANTEGGKEYPPYFGSMPRGSLYTQSIDATKPGPSLFVRDLAPGDTQLSWQPVLLSDPKPLPVASTALVAYDIPATYWPYSGGMIGMDGTLKRSNNNSLTTANGDPCVLANLPSWAWPAYLRRIICRGSIGPVAVNIGSSGVVSLLPDYSQPIPWVDLSGIHYRAKD